MNSEGKFKIRVFEALVSISTAAALGLASWTTKTVVDHSKELAAIKSNRFTASDGLTVWKEIASIREALARLPASFPPDWFQAKVNGIDTRVGVLEEKLDKRLAVIQDSLQHNGESLAAMKVQLDALSDQLRQHLNDRSKQ